VIPSVCSREKKGMPLIFSLVIFWILLGMYFYGNLLLTSEDSELTAFPSLLNAWYPKSENSSVEFSEAFPEALVRTRKQACLSCHTPEIQTEACRRILNTSSSYGGGKTRIDVLREASIFPKGKKAYPPMTGFFNVVINAQTYPHGLWKRGEPVTDIQLQILLESGLLDHSDLRIRLGVVRTWKTTNEQVEQIRAMFKANVDRLTCGMNQSVTIEYWNPTQYECDTINTLREYCSPDHRQHEFVYYLHNKGKSHETNGKGYINVRHWRDYMMFFLFERWELCANSLAQGWPTCGVDLQMDANGVQPHFSGNFWWARCDWVSQNKAKCPYGERNKNKAEFFILRDLSGKIKNGAHVGDAEYEAKRISTLARNLWNADVDHYRRPYPRAKYSCSDDALMRLSPG